MKSNKSGETWRPETGCFHSQPFSGRFTHESVIITNHIIITHQCCLLLPVKTNLIGCFYMSWTWHLICPYLTQLSDLYHLFLFPSCYFLLFLCNPSSWPVFQPGFVSYQAENASTKGPYLEDRNPGWMQPWRTGCGKTFCRRFTWWYCDFSPVPFSLFRCGWGICRKNEMVSCSAVDFKTSDNRTSLFSIWRKSQGLETDFVYKAVWCHLQTALIEKALTWLSWLHSTLASLGQVPPCFFPSFVQSHHSTRPTHPPKENQFVHFWCALPIHHFRPCSHVHLKARFQEEEAICCRCAREQFERDEKSNPSGQNKSCDDMIVYSVLHKTLCKHKVLQRTQGNSCET